MNNFKELLDTIKLEKIETNIFRGNSHKLFGKRVFGGQVLAQALQAAQLTIEDERVVHSMHGYFILAGDNSEPIVYMVERLRDGRSFTTRRVTAIQKGRAIFNMAASFQIQEAGLEHQISRPNVPHPEELLNNQQLLEKYGAQIHPVTKFFLEMKRPIEFRHVETDYLVHGTDNQPERNVWMRFKGEIGNDANLHRMMLAYVSDYHLLTTSLKPHAVTADKLILASLDHAMWFHRDFNANEWLLYSLDSPSASNARGFTRGSVYNLDGELVASVVQEGLIRMRTR